MDLLTQLLEALASPDHPQGEEAVAALRSQLAEVDTQAVEDLRAQALQRFDDLYDEEVTPSEEDLATMERLNTIIDASVVESQTRGQAEAEARDRAAQLAQRARSAGAPDETAEPAEGEGSPAGSAPADEPVAAAAEPVSGELLPAANAGTVAASQRRGGTTSFAGLNRTTPPPRPRTRMEMVAAADVPGFGQGAPLHQMADLVRAVENRFAAMPHGGSSARVEVGLATIRRHRPEAELFEVYNDRSDSATIERAADERRLPGGSLVAAASWCAEPETDYSLCPPLSSLDGMVSTPTVTIRRGGVRLPTFPDYQVIADAINGQIICPPNFNVAKTCIEAPCTTWDAFVPCAIPLCVTNDILQERGYPELIARFLAEVMTAQAHMVNAYKLQQMVAAADDTISAANTVKSIGATHSVFDEISLLVEWMRDLYRMPDGATLEMVAPKWLPGVIRADARKRVQDGGDWTTAQINSRLGALGAAPQWVRDWQPLAVGTGGPPAVFNPPTAWPTEVDILLYPAGTYAIGEADIINLNAIYDNALLKTNKYTALFAEEMVTVIKRCHRALVVTVPLCVNGAMGPQIDNCAVVTP